MTDDARPSDPLLSGISQLAQFAGLSVGWWLSVVNELQHLPEMLQKMREGAENFEQVTRQLAATTAALEQVTEFYANALTEAGRRNAEVVDVLNRQIKSLSGLASPDTAREAASEIQRTVETLARLSPLSLLMPPRPGGKQAGAADADADNA